MERPNLTHRMILPRTGPNDVDNDLDYAAFFQHGDDNDTCYLPDTGFSGFTLDFNDDLEMYNLPSSATPAENTNNNNNNNNNKIGTRKQGLKRQRHTKSRHGCFNCKRRRIRCQETHPACDHCVKGGLNCEYPAAPRIVHQPQHLVPLFSLQDMRFFQHFLLTCFPHQPLGNEKIWTHEVPCLSQKHEYLMHAILGLAASDLIKQDPSLVTSAMVHRLKAIKAIKKTLNDVRKMDTFEEGNALVATCFALTFQSVVLEDGMAEFMTFCRGIVIVATQMWIKGARFLFKNLLENQSAALLRPFIDALPPIRRDWVDMAVAGIQGLESLLCRDDDGASTTTAASTSTSTFTFASTPTPTLNHNNNNLPPNTPTPPNPSPHTPPNHHQTNIIASEYHTHLLLMATSLRTSSFRAYEALCAHYAWWLALPHPHFQALVDPASQTFTLLAAHWIALKQLMAPITGTEHRMRAREPVSSSLTHPPPSQSQSQGGGKGRGGGGGEGEGGEGSSNNNKNNNSSGSSSGDSSGSLDIGMVRWLRYLNRQVDAEHRAYNTWPMWVEEQLARDGGFFRQGNAVKTA